ncbi:hypothetical protein HUU42_12465 [bacterium]|nr:hypothetical protein [bacterium]
MQKLKSNFINRMPDMPSVSRNILKSHPVLLKKISESCKIPREEVPELFTEVLRYLGLVAETHKRLAPSLIVDWAWHEFILCTKPYSDFCQEHFGRYIHHHPAEKENPGQFALTLTYYFEFFGKPPEKYWGQTPEAMCSACEADNNN